MIMDVAPALGINIRCEDCHSFAYVKGHSRALFGTCKVGTRQLSNRANLVAFVQGV